MMFRVSHAGAKGFGVFATRPIARGTRIMADKILLSINNEDTSILDAAARLSAEDRHRLLGLSMNDAKRKSLSYLAAAAWGSFPSLGSITQSRDLLNIFYNNNFSISGTSGKRAVFLNVARLNHSCVPNAQGNLNTALPGRQFTIHALREIGDGEEITISYLHDELAIRSARQQRLKEGYGFECACEICSITASAERHDQSHQRRLKIQEMLVAFSENKAAAADASRELSLTRAIIEAYEQEGLAGRELASLYFAAAGLATELGYSKEASGVIS
ncbi:putative set domain-containing protein 5 [Diaporthe ampelina]|uniref:Putative set domain-containing protein 5 n=1 Tax=Diaporthe ampelina TaxID=1214573 RepID=A0A0G2FU35_9PEZI|nr:putative set domain-containing protein 5 [Diaporthe ampelina]